jgi:N-acetylglucosamine-6-phosphate deacetylase
MAQSLDETRQNQGLQQHTPRSFALVGGKLVLGDGQIIPAGVILVQGEKLVGVGAVGQVNVPAGFLEIDLTGKVVYPGLIDAYRPVSIDVAAQTNAYWNPQVRPELDVRDSLTNELTEDAPRRSQGIVAAIFAPTGAILDGCGAVANLGGWTDQAQRRIVRSGVGQHGVLTVTRGPRPPAGTSPRVDVYPSSPMGAVALARQAMYDAKWYREAWQVVRVNSRVPLPETNLALEACSPLMEGERALFIRAGNELATLRADRFAREFGVGLVIVGSGREYRRLSDVAATGRAIICPLNFPSAPNVATIAQSHAVSLEALMHWDHAPENPARLAQANVKLAFTTVGLENPTAFLKQVREAVQRGLQPDAALRALTIDAAEIAGVADQLGSLENGKLASFLITDGDLFDSKTKIEQTWVAGKRYEVKPPTPPNLAGSWNWQVAASGNQPAWSIPVEFKRRGEQWTARVQPEGNGRPATDQENKKAPEPQQKSEQASKEESKEESGEESKQESTEGVEEATEGSRDRADAPKPAEDAGAGPTSDQRQPRDDDSAAAVKFERLQVEGLSLLGIVQGPGVPVPGVARWNLVIDRLDADSYSGRLLWPDGTAASLVIQRIEAAKAEGATGGRPEGSAEAESNTAEKSEQPGSTESPDKVVNKAADKRSSFPINFPLGMYGRTEPPVRPSSVLFRDFTVWTSGPDGILAGGSVWVVDGLIQQVFADSTELAAVELPEGTIVVEGEGRHLSPGLIDCHSHAATDSGVNEGSQAITAEVRIGDFVDCNDITIYRQLAGGLTAANVLHGSANPIGGQNQVIKLRWSSNDEQLKFQEAPPGIKFALGENVKRSNSTQSATRYPGSRMGVDQIIRDAFYNATEYRLRHRQWADRRDGLPPRIDLELEALSEIIDGKRWVHCHSYRQDEILTLIRTLDQFHVQIGTFQHIMEGYKVADSMAHHGAMASAFADWWAYKLEVADAIPYGGAIMHDQGIVVSFNSDDGELGRRMNHEAAKAVKYGGIEPAEALKFVTLNPAKQLRVDSYVGSLEVGKHADVVVWSGSPLSTLSRVDQTWIDGRCYFDRLHDGRWHAELTGWKQALIQKILDTGASMAAPGVEIDSDSSRDWPRYDEYCRASGE